MTYDIQRNDVWYSLLEAEYQRLYWHAKAASYVNIDRWVQISLAIMSSAVLLSAIGENGAWKFISSIAAVMAIALPFLNYTRRSVTMTDVSSRWHRLANEYSSMWRSISSDGYSEQKFMELKEHEVEIGKLTFELPLNDKKLQQHCYDQVLKERGVL